uniref:FERM domain-containing protein n=1 Tax=Strongyloides papillosus TaxID=174720 RepID=A0A0N5B1S9_STREA
MTNDGEEPNIEDDPTIQIGVSHKDLSPATVYFLDGKKKLFYIHKNSEGEILIDMVGKYLQLQERDYFGLTYYDQKGNKHWVYSDRRISKKLKSMPWEFYFEVKFYPQEPSQLADDFTRYLLCLQVRQDIYMKKLPVTFATEALLASYVVQELRGDYHEYPPLLDYVSFLGEAKTSESITPEFVEKVKELHKQHKGLTPGEAESAYLEVAKKLNMYGIFTFPAKDNHNDVIIGISAPGISVFSDQVRVHRFLWNHIVKFAYKKNIFSVKVKPDKAVNGKSTFSYKMDDNGNAKRTWRCGVEHHTFFRLIQPEDDLKNGVICAPRGNRIFHYHGRTQYQSKLHASMFDHVSSDINRSDNIRVGKSEVCYIKPVEILDDRDKIESNVEHPVSVNLMDEENFVTPVKESRSNKNQFTKDTLNSSGYGSGPSSSRVRFADRLPIKLEGKKVRRNLFGKGKEDDIERETFPAIASTYPKDKEESKTDIVLTNNEFDEIPIDYMVSVYHNGQSINNKKRNNVCCGSIGGGNKKGHIKKDDISEPMTLTEDVEKYPLRYKVDVYHSGGRYSQKYGINKNKKKFKRLTHEGVNEVVKRDKVDLTFYPHDNSEHPVKERLEKVYELECEPLRKYASKYHSGLSVMSKKEAKEQKKIAKRDRLLTHESTPPKNSKSKCFSCNCAGSQLPKDKSSKMKFDDNYPYGLSKEPYEGPLSMERRKEEFKGAPLESVCSSYEIPKYKPANKKRSSALTCIKPQKRVKKDEEYSRKDSWPKDDEEERHHVVKKMLRDEDYPIEERKQKTEFIEKIEERPIIEYDVARTVIDTEKDWSLKVGEGKESGIKKTTRISKTLLPQRTSSPHSSNENIDGHCHDKLDNIPIESEVKIHHTPEHIITKVEEIKTFKEPSYNDIDIPSSSHVYEIKTTTNIYNLNTEPYEGNVEVISKNNDIDEDPLSEHVKYYDIPKYPKKFEKKIEVKESIIRTQNIENEKLSPIIQKEVSFSNDNQDSSAKKEKTNSLTRFIGRFNKKDSDVGKKKQGPVMSDLDSGVDDILSGTEAGTLSRKDDQKEDIKEAKKLEKKKKKSLLCSSTGKKGSMAYLPIEHIRHSSSDKGYPGKEEPYTGDLEPFNKTSELPTESLRNIVQVYHSGLSDVKPSWNRRFVIFSRTKHEGVEEVIDKNEINKESYQLLNNQPYEGPLETMRHDDDISTEPIKHYSKVYHPGQSVLGGTKKKENVKKSSKKRVSTPVDSDEDDYHPKDKTSSLSRFMGFFNRRGGKSNNYDTGNGGMTTENDSGMDASNSSAEVPTKYSLESYDKKNKNKNRKYVLNTEPFLGTYDQTIRINELQTEPLKDSVDVYHSGQSVSTLKNKKLYLNDQYTESDTDDERRNTRSNTLTRIIGKLHMPKKSNGGNGSDLGYPKISQKYEGEYEKINRIDEVKKIPLDQEVQIYDIPKYQAKIEKKDSEPSCSYCAPVGRKQSLNVYDKNEELSGDENTLSKTENKSLKASNDKDIKLSIETDIEGKYKDPKLSSEKDITATVMVPESMVNDDLMISIPEDAFEGKDIDRNINAHIIIDNEPKLKVRSRSKKNNVSCFGKSKSKPINLEAYPPQVKYDGATMDLKTSHSLPKTSLEDHVDIYPIPKYQDKKKYSKKCSAFNCVRKNRMEEKGNDYYMEKTSSDKSEDESHLEAKAKVGIESRKPELEAFYEMPSKEKVVEVKTSNNLESELEIENKKQKTKCVSLNCAKNSPDHKSEGTYEVSPKKFNISNEYNDKIEAEDIHMTVLVPEEMASGKVKISVPDTSFKIPEEDIKAHIVIDEPEIEKYTTTFEHKKGGLSYVASFGDNNYTYEPSVEVKHDIPSFEKGVKIETPKLNIDAELKKPKVKEPKCGQLNCAKQSPKKEFDVSYEISQHKADLNLEMPEVNIDREVKLEMPEVNIDREVKLEVEVPTGNINIETPIPEIQPMEIEIKEPAVHVEMPQLNIDTEIKEPKVKGPKCGSLNCSKKKMEGDFDASYELSPKHIELKTELPKVEVENDVEVKLLVPEHLAESDFKVSIPEVSVDLPSHDMKAHILVEKPKVSLPEIKVKPRKTGVSCFACFGRKKGKLPANLDAYPQQYTYEGPIVELDSQMPMKTEKLDQHVNLYPIPKYKNKGKVGKKCGSLSCGGKKPIKTDAPSVKGDLEVDIPEIKAEADIKKPEVQIDAKKPKVKGPKCAPLSCFRKTPKAGLEASYDIPSKKLDVDIETPEVNVDVEGPSVKVDVPEVHADIKKPEVQIDAKKPKIKGPKCAPLSCFRKTPKAGLEASYDIPSKKLDVDVEGPSIEVDAPEITAEASIDKPEIKIDAKKPKVKGPKCAPLSCFRKTPKAGLEASYDIPSKKLDVDIETPEVNVDVEGPSVKVDVPEIHADIKKPEIKIDAKKPKVKGPRCAPLSCFRKTPKAGLEASYDIPSKKLNVDIETPEVNIDVEGPSVRIDTEVSDLKLNADVPELHADIKKPEIQIDAKKPKVKGPKCAPLSCLRKTPKAGLEASYDIPSKKLDVDVEGPSIEVNAPQLTAEASIDKPEIKIDAKKPKVKGPKCAPLSCFRKTPKAGLEASYDIPSKKLDVDIETPEVNVDVEGPSVKVDVPAGLEASYDIPSKKIDVDVETPEVNVDVEGPSVKVDVPELHADIKKPEIQIDVKKPKAKGPKCGKLNCVKKTPEVELDSSYKLPTIKNDLQIELPDVKIENDIKLKTESLMPHGDIEIQSFDVDVKAPKVDVTIPKLEIDTKIKGPKVKGPKFSPPHFGKRTYETDFDASCELSPKKLHLDMETPDFNYEIKKPEVELPSFELPSSKIEFEQPKIDIDRNVKLEVEVPSRSINIEAPEIVGEFKKPEIDFDASYEVSPKHIELKTELPRVNVENDIEIKLLVPEHLAESDFKVSIPEPSIDFPSHDMKAHILVEEPKVSLPEIKVKPRKTGVSCFACFGRKKGKLPANLDAYPQQQAYEGPVVELGSEMPMKTEKLDQHVDLYPIPKYKNKGKVDKKCGALNCAGKKQSPDIEVSYTKPDIEVKTDVPSVQGDIKVDVEHPITSVHIPEVKAEADIKKPKVEIEKSKKITPKCGSLNCFRKAPRDEYEASYDIITKQIQSGYLTNENDGKDIQVNVLVPEHLVNENLKISLPENALEMDGSDIKGYISIENEKYLQPIAKEPLKKSLKLRRPLSCFSNKNRNKGNEVNVKELKNVYESHYPLLLTSNENELERIDKDKELERQIIGDYVQVYQIPKYKPLNKKSTINCGINSCISKDKNIPTESANDKHESSWGIIGEGLTKTTGEVYYPSTKLDIKNYPQSEAWTGHVETMTHQSPLKSEPLHSHCNLYDVPKYAPSVEVNIPKHKQHFGFEYKAEGPDIVVESRDETVDGMVTPFSTPVTTPANFESNIPQSIKIYEDSLQKELNFDYNIPKIEITKEESSVNIQVPSLTVTSYDEPISTSKNEDNKHKMSVESLKFVHDLEEKLNLHVSINENNEQPILEQINDGQIDIVLPPPPLAIKEAEKELPHPKSKFLGCIPRKDKRVKQKNKQLTDGGDSGISTDDDNEHSSNKKNSLSNFSCMPFMCNGNKNKRLESPYIKATSGQPQQFGISTKKYSGEHIAIEPITEMETNPLSQHVSKYHSGESYVKPKTHFHLLPSCIKKQDSVKRKSKNDKDKIVSDEKLNNELDVLEYQRVTDTSKTLTSMFTTTDPLSGDLNCHLTITLLQKMDCECKVIFCRTDNEEVGACCKSCAYSKCYQTLSATVNMNNMTNGVPEITISQPSKPSLLSILKKPFKGTNKNKKDENYKKISKKNKTSHYSSDSSSNSADIKEKEEEKEKNIIDAVVPTNDQYKLNSQNSAANMVLNNSNNVSLNKPPINSSSTGIHQNNMRSSVLNGTVSLEQSSGPYREAEPSDGEVIREERIEHVYKLRGTGNAPTIDPSDMSLSATLAKCVEENSSLPRVTMVCKDVHVKDYGILEPYITEESNLPHTTIQSWQETDVGPDTVYTETDPSGKVTKKTIKTQQTKHTIQKQSYQTFNVDDNMLPPKNTTIDKTIKVTTPRVGSGTKGPVMETRTRTVAYECHPEEALVTKDGDIPGEFVSSKTVTTGNKTIETITYKTEKDGIVETRVEHKVTIHSDDGVDHDAELSQALLDATSMDPDMTVETIEIKQETQN